MDVSKPCRSEFFRQGDGWYFVRADGRQVGPFDRMYEIVVSACVHGTWQSREREITGAAMAEALCGNWRSGSLQGC